MRPDDVSEAAWTFGLVHRGPFNRGLALNVMNEATFAQAMDEAAAIARHFDAATKPLREALGEFVTLDDECEIEGRDGSNVCLTHRFECPCPVSFESATLSRFTPTREAE